MSLAFITGIYHDARSSEFQNKYIYLAYYVHLVGIKRRILLQECMEREPYKCKFNFCDAKNKLVVATKIYQNRRRQLFE